MRRWLVFVLVLASCAKRSEPPLPGDSVSASGSVTLVTPKFSTAPAPAPEPLGAIESKLYPADLIMEHQAAIHLEAAQRESILKEVEKGQNELTRLQWDLHAEKEKLATILDADKVDETKAQSQATRVMDLENKIKTAHLGMLIRIKNLLTPDQQKKLRDLRESRKVDAG